MRTCAKIPQSFHLASYSDDSFINSRYISFASLAQGAGRKIAEVKIEMKDTLSLFLILDRPESNYETIKVLATFQRFRSKMIILTDAPL